MPVGVGGGVVAVDEVPAAVVVDEPVAVVVDGVGLAARAALTGIGGELALQIAMTEIDAGVDDRHGLPGPHRLRPGLRGVDIGIGGACHPGDRLAGVVQAPQERPVGVGALGAHHAVGFCVAHLGAARQRAQRRGALASGGAHQLGVAQAQAPHPRYARACTQIRAVLPPGVSCEGHDDLADLLGLRALRRRNRELAGGGRPRQRHRAQQSAEQVGGEETHHPGLYRPQAAAAEDPVDRTQRSSGIGERRRFSPRGDSRAPLRGSRSRAARRRPRPRPGPRSRRACRPCAPRGSRATTPSRALQRSWRRPAR